MTLDEFLRENDGRLESDGELFVREILSRIPGLHFDRVTAQHPYEDLDGRSRSCDFVIQEGEAGVAIEIESHRESGEAPSRIDFLDAMRRRAALSNQGWQVLRISRADLLSEPERCADHLALMLRKLKDPADLDPDEERRLQAFDDAAARRAAAPRDRLQQSDEVEVSGAEAKDAAPPIPPARAPRRGLALAFVAAAIVAVVALLFTREGSAPPQAQGERSAAMAVEPSCSDAIDWSEARAHIGERVAVVGPLEGITESRPGVRGDPTWFEIGARFPDDDRLTLVLWGNRKSRFPIETLQGYVGKRVCAKGEIGTYRDVPQIVLYDPGQLSLVP